MPNWLLKSALHRAISWLPQPQFWNGLFQRAITKSTTLTSDRFEGQLSECRRHLDAYLGAHPGAADFRILEIGTGWYPTLPVGLHLCGAGEIWTFDIDPLVNSEQLETMLNFYVRADQSGQLQRFLPAVRPERMRRLKSLLDTVRHEKASDTLKRIQIYMMVGGAQQTGLSAQSIDLFFSNGVLEYIPPTALNEILAECRRIASPQAVMSHRLNLVDQFSYFDHSITPYNFLCYTSSQWRWLNSPLTWQNRLRVSDFREMLRQSGWQIIAETNISGSVEDLKRIKLAPEFERYSQRDLLVLHSWIAARLATGR